MLKADLARLIALASDDEARRVAAVAELEALPRRHFYQYAVDKKKLPRDWLESAAAAWHATPSTAVRAWIARAVGLAQHWLIQPVEPLLFDFLDIDGPYVEDIARFVVTHKMGKPGAKDRLMALHRHPDPGVRFQLASRLSGWMAADGVDWATDAPIVRRLMLDSNSAVRNFAVSTLEKIDTLGPKDFEVLLDVVNMDNGSARYRAEALLEAISAKHPECSRATSPPRVPLLRTDGLYSTDVTELDDAGRWVTMRCLRFLPDGRVEAFGTDEAPVDLPLVMPHHVHASVHGEVRKDGADVTFTLQRAAGPEDCTGRIDGSTLRLVRVDRATGRKVEADYGYSFIDWDAPAPPAPAPAPPPKKARGRAAEPLPFERVRPDSLRIADAAKWYLLMVARLPVFVEGIPGDEARFERAWFLKNEMRNAAAKALYDPSLKRQFFEAMPLPAADEMLASAASDGPDPHAAALRALASVTLAERRAFPGTLGEAIGATYHGPDGVYVMTEEGWQRQ